MNHLTWFCFTWLLLLKSPFLRAQKRKSLESTDITGQGEGQPDLLE